MADDNPATGAASSSGGGFDPSDPLGVQPENDPISESLKETREDIEDKAEEAASQGPVGSAKDKSDGGGGDGNVGRSPEGPTERVKEAVSGVKEKASDAGERAQQAAAERGVTRSNIRSRAERALGNLKSEARNRLAQARESDQLFTSDELNVGDPSDVGFERVTSIAGTDIFARDADTAAAAQAERLGQEFSQQRDLLEENIDEDNLFAADEDTLIQGPPERLPVRGDVVGGPTPPINDPTSVPADADPAQQFRSERTAELETQLAQLRNAPEDAAFTVGGERVGRAEAIDAVENRLARVSSFPQQALQEQVIRDVQQATEGEVLGGFSTEQLSEEEIRERNREAGREVFEELSPVEQAAVAAQTTFTDPASAAASLLPGGTTPQENIGRQFGQDIVRPLRSGADRQDIVRGELVETATRNPIPLAAGGSVGGRLFAGGVSRLAAVSPRAASAAQIGGELVGAGTIAAEGANIAGDIQRGEFEEATEETIRAGSVLAGFGAGAAARGTPSSVTGIVDAARPRIEALRTRVGRSDTFGDLLSQSGRSRIPDIDAQIARDVGRTGIRERDVPGGEELPTLGESVPQGSRLGTRDVLSRADVGSGISADVGRPPQPGTSPRTRLSAEEAQVLARNRPVEDVRLQFDEGGRVTALELGGGSLGSLRGTTAQVRTRLFPEVGASRRGSLGGRVETDTIIQEDPTAFVEPPATRLSGSRTGPRFTDTVIRNVQGADDAASALASPERLAASTGFAASPNIAGTPRLTPQEGVVGSLVFGRTRQETSVGQGLEQPTQLDAGQVVDLDQFQPLDTGIDTDLDLGLGQADFLRQEIRQRQPQREQSRQRQSLAAVPAVAVQPPVRRQVPAVLPPGRGNTPLFRSRPTDTGGPGINIPDIGGFEADIFEGFEQDRGSQRGLVRTRPEPDILSASFSEFAFGSESVPEDRGPLRRRTRQAGAFAFLPTAEQLAGGEEFDVLGDPL